MPHDTAPVDQIVLRPCTLQDADTLALVASATFLETFAGIIEGDAILAHCLNNNSSAAFRKYLADPRTHALLALTPQRAGPIGYSMITAPDLPLPDIAPQDLELKRIYLFARFHGSGLATRLLATSIANARTRNAPRLLLGVYADNHRALAFYYRNGFTQVGTRTFQVGDQFFHDLVLGLSL